jgi:hypothetical protein
MVDRKKAGMAVRGAVLLAYLCAVLVAAGMLIAWAAGMLAR